MRRSLNTRDLYVSANRSGNDNRRYMPVAESPDCLRHRGGDPAQARRLADEYDAAQERGEVASSSSNRGNQWAVSKGNEAPVTAQPPCEPPMG